MFVTNHIFRYKMRLNCLLREWEISDVNPRIILCEASDIAARESFKVGRRGGVLKISIPPSLKSDLVDIRNFLHAMIAQTVTNHVICR